MIKYETHLGQIGISKDILKAYRKCRLLLLRSYQHDSQGHEMVAFKSSKSAVLPDTGIKVRETVSPLLSTFT